MTKRKYFKSKQNKKKYNKTYIYIYIYKKKVYAWHAKNMQ